MKTGIAAYEDILVPRAQNALSAYPGTLTTDAGGLKDLPNASVATTTS